MKIVLTGFMGAGKSATGKILARQQEGDDHGEPAKDQYHREENNDAIMPPVFLGHSA